MSPGDSGTVGGGLTAGTGLIRRCMSEACRRRTEGFITEFERIRVPY
jgi:hypothetical protein